MKYSASVILRAFLGVVLPLLTICIGLFQHIPWYWAVLAAFGVLDLFASVWTALYHQGFVPTE